MTVEYTYRIKCSQCWDDHFEERRCYPIGTKLIIELPRGWENRGKTEDGRDNYVCRQCIESEEKQNKASQEPWPKETQIYLRGNKEGNGEQGKELGLKGEALTQFIYAVYELEVTVLVYEDGHCEIKKIDGRDVADPNIRHIT
jgi:hypothetical protein